MFSQSEGMTERIKYPITITLHHKLMISEPNDNELMLISQMKSPIGR